MSDVATVSSADPLEGSASPLAEVLRRVFEQSVAARLLLSIDGVVLRANDACKDLFGWSASELKGRRFRDLAPLEVGDSLDRLHAAFRGSDSSGAIRFSLAVLQRNGPHLPVHITARVMSPQHDSRLVSMVIRPHTSDDSDKRVRDLIDAGLDGYVLVDGDGQIVMSNWRVREMFGYSEDELIDQPVELLVPDRVRAGHVGLRGQFTGRARRHQMGMGNQVAGRRSDGSTFPAQIVLSTLSTADGVLICATVRDLTELRSLEEQTGRIQNRFLTTMSHELRTPLTSILAGAEMLLELLEGVDDESLRRRLERFADIIVRGAHREKALVDDLLALANLDGDGELTPPRTPADLQIIVENAARSHQFKAESAGLTLHTQVSTIPVLATADEKWVTRAVDCLVGNAVKFTPPGGHIHLATGVDRDTVWTDITDTGPGIAPGLEEKVFERFYRGDEAVAAEKPGAGLGLAIARAIVEAAGGALTVLPQTAGARFHLVLPAVGDR